MVRTGIVTGSLVAVQPNVSVAVNCTITGWLDVLLLNEMLGLDSLDHDASVPFVTVQWKLDQEEYCSAGGLTPAPPEEPGQRRSGHV